MKKILTTVFLTANTALVFAATGERSDDYLVVVVPLAFLLIMWGGREIKNKIKTYREAKHKKELEQLAQESAGNTTDTLFLDRRHLGELT